MENEDMVVPGLSGHCIALTALRWRLSTATVTSSSMTVRLSPVFVRSPGDGATTHAKRTNSHGGWRAASRQSPAAKRAVPSGRPSPPFTHSKFDTFDAPVNVPPSAPATSSGWNWTAGCPNS